MRGQLLPHRGVPAAGLVTLGGARCYNLPREPTHGVVQRFLLGRDREVHCRRLALSLVELVDDVDREPRDHEEDRDQEQRVDDLEHEDLRSGTLRAYRGQTCELSW